MTATAAVARIPSTSPTTMPPYAPYLHTNAFASGSSSSSTPGLTGQVPDQISPRRVTDSSASGAAAAAGPSKARARLNPFEYEDERRKSWLRQDMPERLLESGWSARLPPELQHLQGGTSTATTTATAGSSTPPTGSHGGKRMRGDPAGMELGGLSVGTTATTIGGPRKDAAAMASSATLPGYPPTPVTAGAQLPPSAPFGGDLGSGGGSSGRGYRPGPANVPAGLADMEARVAGLFPNNPRPFGMIHSDSPWLGDRFAAGPSSGPATAAAVPGQKEPATSSPLNGKAADRAGDPPRSGRAGNRRKQKFTRTRTGCLTCRARRIKCDEGLPVCKRCIIAKKECQWASDEGPRRNGEGEVDTSRSVTPETQDHDPYKIYSRPSSPFRDQPSKSNLPAVVESQSVEQVAADMLSTGGGLISPNNINFDESFVSRYRDTDGGALPGIRPVASAGQKDQFDSYSQLYRLDPSSGAAGAFGDAGSYRQDDKQHQDRQTEDKGRATAPGQALTADLAGKHQSWGQPGQPGQVQQAGAPLLTTPNFLLPWFPTAEERSLILHYCANAADLMMAIPSGLNPMLAINLPLALDSPRGINTSADALRVTLLGIAAVHQAFLLARSGVSTAQTASMFQYASNLRNTGKDLVRRAAMHPDGARSDAALGAGTALATIDIFFGGSGWSDNFRLAKDMIAFRGGPAEMLKASKPTLLQDGVSVSAARLVLEILTIYETFGSLVTGEEPTLMSEKWGDWWFKTGQTTYEEHSVEKQFGMSRVMVHLFNRLTRLLARVQRSKATITETDAVEDLVPSQDRQRHSQSPNASPTKTREDASAPNSLGIIGLDGGARGKDTKASASRLAKPVDPLVREARQLNEDVDAWIDSLQLATLEHERVQVGNRAYAHTMKILLLRNVFKYPREDERVQRAAIEVIRHCSHSTALLGMSIDLTWPAIIAGCCVDGDSRAWLLTLLEGFKAQCCFDIETAGRIIGEVWRRSDAGEPRADWKDVCDDLGLQVLLC